MSKELEAFERIKNHTLSYAGDIYKTFTDSREKQVQDLDIIETTLKEYDGAKKHIEALNKEIIENSIKSIKLKVLEIIKEKRVDACYFMNCRTLEEYNDDVLASYAYEENDAEQRMLTQEEYDLLKEVLL